MENAPVERVASKLFVALEKDACNKTAIPNHAEQARQIKPNALKL